MSDQPPAEPPRAGDDSAPPLCIRRLIEEHHRDLYGYAYRLCGNAADAEDLTQQTFLIANEKKSQVRSPEKAHAWLFAVLRSCWLKSRRRRRPTAAGSIDMEMDDLCQPSAENFDIDSGQLQDALDGLPDEFKLVLAMFYFEGCSYKEIAAELDIPPGTVMSRLARAKSHLRRRLLGEEAGRAGAPSPASAKRPTIAAANRSRHGA